MGFGELLGNERLKENLSGITPLSCELPLSMLLSFSLPPSFPLSFPHPAARTRQSTKAITKASLFILYPPSWHGSVPSLSAPYCDLFRWQ